MANEIVKCTALVLLTVILIFSNHHFQTVGTSLYFNNSQFPSTSEPNPVPGILQSYENHEPSKKLIVFKKDARALWTVPMRSGKLKENCDFTNCEITYNETLAKNADAIVYPFWAAPGTHPSWRKPEQRFVFMSIESPKTKSFFNKMVRHKDPFYNLTMSYRKSSDVVYDYGNKCRALRELKKLYGTLDKQEILGKFQTTDQFLKTGGALSIISNCVNAYRVKWVNDLKFLLKPRGFNVETTGRCFRTGINKYSLKKAVTANTKRTEESMIPEIETEFHGKINVNYTVSDYFEHRTEFDKWVRGFKFYFSFENSYCKDYITEKFWRRGINIGVVPIVAGLTRKEYEKSTEMPSNSFIHLEDFGDKQSLAEFLGFLAKNETEYFKKLLWWSRKDLKECGYRKSVFGEESLKSTENHSRMCSLCSVKGTQYPNHSFYCLVFYLKAIGAI